MSLTTDNFQVLVGTAIAAKGVDIGALPVGTIGVFNAETNTSIDATTTPLPNDIYIAVGVDNGLGGNPDDINKSAGLKIHLPNVAFYQAKQYTAPVSQVIKVDGFTGTCNTEFGIKIEFRNQKIYKIQGPNQFTKTYMVKAGCCGNTCTPCAPQDPNTAIAALVNLINMDIDQLVSASFLVPTLPSTPTAPTYVVAENGKAVGASIAAGDVLTNPENIQAFVNAYSALNTDTDNTNNVVGSLQLIANPLGIQNYCDINLMYFNPRSTIMIVSLPFGFTCNGTVTETTAPVFEQGSWYDVREREYIAGGWNGRPGPYRTLNLTGTAAPGYRYFSQSGTNYDRINLTYEAYTYSGPQYALSNIATEIYIPTGTVAATLTGILDALLPKFTPQTPLT